jgi:hypothetical protein
MRLWRRGAQGNVYRITRGMKYISFCIAATITMFHPSVVITDTFSDYAVLPYLWSGLLLLGSLTSLAGIITKTWVGEYIGLSGVIAALVLYCFGCFTPPDLDPSRIFLGFMIFGSACSTFARRQDIVFQKRVADYENRVREGKPGL